jgi:AraC family transcriptional regulator, regulatory protein of adaptative response / methylated-DNA-[protein]-cysteine methyltransferase
MKKNRKELYEVMRSAIDYMREHALSRPSSTQIAKVVGMSPSHFEHVFAEWAGIPPKRYLSYLVAQKAKFNLHSGNVLKAAYSSGLSGPGRLHGLMVTHEAVSPGEFKSGEIEITYGVHLSPFGWCVIGLTKRGVCHLSFLDQNNLTMATRRIREDWSKAHLLHDQHATAPYINRIFYPDRKNAKRPLHLLIKGTNFQVKVWEALLAIPDGQVSSYAAIARAVGSPKAVRAAGTACGKNGIAYLIPCHRVLTSKGSLGGYRWGVERKAAILARESVRNI